MNLIEGKVSMDKLAITKALRGYYKNPNQIGHAVLAERIGKRDPGNKPKAGDSGYNSYVKFEAEMNAGPSESIYWLIGMGVVLFLWYRVENNISVVENQTNTTE